MSLRRQSSVAAAARRRATNPALPNIQGVAYWKDLFDAQEASTWAYNEPLSLANDSREYYDLAYGVDAYISMFEATGELFYLNRALTLVNNMIDDAVAVNTLPSGWTGAYEGWVSKATDPGNASTFNNEVPLFESYVWRYVTRLLTAIKKNTAVYGSATVYDGKTYAAHYAAILAFTEVSMFDKWYNRSVNSYIYRQNTNMASHWAYISCHLRLHTVNATRQTRCDTVRSNIDAVGLPNYGNDDLRAKMTASLGRALAGAYSWNDAWNATSRPGQDVAHACAEITWICESLDYHTTWTQTDVDRFGKTLTDLIMPTHALSVDGTGSSTGWIADGWPKLGRFSVPVQQALQSYDMQTQAQYRASMAENARRWGVM